MHRGSWVVAVVVWLSGCAHFECRAHGGNEVRSIDTEHFVVISQLPLEQHRAEAERLELLWDTFAAFFGASIDHARIPVLLLDDPASVRSFSSGATGFMRIDGPNVLLVGTPGEGKETGSTAHELTHLVSAYMLPRQPRWVAEGLATLFEDAYFKDDFTVAMGRWNQGRARDAAVNGVLSIEQLTTWTNARFDATDATAYGSAWAWLHYLVNRDEPRLKRLFYGLRSNRPLAEVVAEVFPLEDVQRLQQAVNDYLEDAHFRGWETKLRRSPKVIDPVVLSDWEVHLLRSRLFDSDTAASNAELKKALALAPRPLPPQLAVVEARLEHRDPTTLLTTYPASPDVLVAARVRDLALLREPLATTEGATNVELLLLAAKAALAAKDLDAARRFASASEALAPWSAEVVGVQLEIDLQTHACDEAERRLALVRNLTSATAALEPLAARLAACPRP